MGFDSERNIKAVESTRVVQTAARVYKEGFEFFTHPFSIIPFLFAWLKKLFDKFDLASVPLVVPRWSFDFETNKH